MKRILYDTGSRVVVGCLMSGPQPPHLTSKWKLVYSRILLHKAYKYSLSILSQQAMHVLIDALRNISPSELKYDFFHIIYDARFSNC